uniref:NR LBD domain-containing protein n=1 Tax=Panagrolaimus sp. JU765 TaxID=591449 RepID=A0AC34Q1C9_9BILA
MWCRIVTHYADWVSHIPEFTKLSYHDQLKLIVDRSAPCVSVLIAYKTYITNGEGIVLSGGSYFPRDELQQEIMDPAIRPYLKRLTDILYDEFVIPATEMKMTEIEYSLLRLLVFLMPSDNMSYEGKEIIRQASNFYRNILCLQIKKQFPKWDDEEILDRMTKIMTFLPLMEIAKSASNAGFSVMTLFDIAQMKGELIYDVHVKRD